ncbi:hypothetical protein O9H85_08230 [Paenibacillus filicis]|uniref:Uncharacterized protein n=1 Tax=Paenibacillus gyeongsangnamensis TaxID=3388067 RepID=A0ABT4Q6C1_9BACL|nr:hypothetical protein [Paenibacillus filicis]MCZ8512420.1 hypothetical protein [Paenibacillus filicis]
MSDWKDEIKSRINTFAERRSIITETLSILINELRSAPYAIKGKVETVDEQNLIWRVTIDNKSEIISFVEMAEMIPNGFIPHDHEQLTKNLTEIILNKFKW